MPKKILLADDSITIQKVVELTFSDGDYEVTAVNNGAKAVAKLAEMRPDIILSDIIMPEKNGYEVCEYVKSHPEFRNIPVVLLTGTFEPFDPDRAEKAGCDAVVTKPFESQSLIHKVEELIAQSQTAASAPAAAAPEPEPAGSPWMDDTNPPQPSAFSTASGGFPAAPASDAFTHDNDIFAAPPTPQATTEMPFDTPAESPFGAPPPADAFSGETRAFPKMSFEEMQQMASGSAPAASPAPPPPPAAPEPPPAPEPSPWDDAPAPQSFGTTAFEAPKFDAPPSFDTPSSSYSFNTPSFDEPPAAPEPEAESPFGAPPPAEEFSGETRAFPRMSFEEMQQMASGTAAPTPAPPPPPAAPEPPPAPSPWDEQDTPAFGGETRAFPKMSFDDMQQMAASTPPPVPEPEVSPWGEPEPAAPAFGSSSFGGDTPAFGGDTPAFGGDTPAFGGDTPAFGQDTPAFGEDAPAFGGGGETRAFPKLTYDDFQSLSQQPPMESKPEPAPWSEPSEPAWTLPETPTEPEGPAAVESFPTAASPFSEPSSAPFNEPPQPASEAAVPEDLPFAETTAAEPELEPVESLMTGAVEEEEEWAPAATAAAEAEPEEPVAPPPALAPEAPPLPIAARGSDLPGDLTDEQIDRIARRVVELMSEQVVRNIAWEVIPDLAEMVVKERIRQLEAEA